MLESATLGEKFTRKSTILSISSSSLFVKFLLRSLLPFLTRCSEVWTSALENDDVLPMEKNDSNVSDISIQDSDATRRVLRGLRHSRKYQNLRKGTFNLHAVS